MRFGLDVRPEERKHLSMIVVLKDLLIRPFIHLEIEIKKVLGFVILVHTHILKCQFYTYIAFRQILSQFDELPTKTLNELLIDVLDPRLHTNGHILIKQMQALLLLQSLLQSNYAAMVEFSEKICFFEHNFRLLTPRHSPSHQHSHCLVIALLAFAERVLLSHVYYDLSRHYIMTYLIILI